MGSQEVTSLKTSDNRRTIAGCDGETENGSGCFWKEKSRKNRLRLEELVEHPPSIPVADPSVMK